ncbi:hypothetical protein ACWCQK_24490 [Streptomyces sp. NPDC002306]
MTMPDSPSRALSTPPANGVIDQFAAIFTTLHACEFKDPLRGRTVIPREVFAGPEWHDRLFHRRLRNSIGSADRRNGEQMNKAMKRALCSVATSTVLAAGGFAVIPATSTPAAA